VLESEHWRPKRASCLVQRTEMSLEAVMQQAQALLPGLSGHVRSKLSRPYGRLFPRKSRDDVLSCGTNVIASPKNDKTLCPCISRRASPRDDPHDLPGESRRGRSGIDLHADLPRDAATVSWVEAVSVEGARREQRRAFERELRQLGH
jgi:hypothetical protein